MHLAGGGSAPGTCELSFETGEPLDAVRQRLADAGYEVEPWSTSPSGTPSASATPTACGCRSTPATVSSGPDTRPGERLLLTGVVGLELGAAVSSLTLVTLLPAVVGDLAPAASSACWSPHRWSGRSPHCRWRVP